VKFSIRQILASAAGAVIAAVIASSFGVKGTIVGVAIGSAAATFATALVAQSIERGHEAVKQVVVRAPDSSALLRKLGGTATSSAGGAPAAPAEGPDQLEISAVADAPATERIDATTLPMRPAGPPDRPGRPRTFSWKTIAGTAAIVFVLALMFITAIELISGKPLAAIFGNTGGGTTVKNIFTPPPSPAPTTTTTTPTTPTSSTTSSTTTATSTTTSTTVPASSTTTVAPGASTTTTGPAGSVGSTTTSPSGGRSP
jgi:hypothetical protein